MGCPVSSKPRRWRNVRNIVAGRIVNVHTHKDLVLQVVARLHAGGKGNISGLGPVYVAQGVECAVANLGIENFDCSHLVSGHAQYPLRVGNILEELYQHEPS